MSLDHPSDFVKQQVATRDAFLGGRLNLSQPRHGFRAGLDSVLLGASVSPESRTLLDLGAGVGTAALVALAHSTQLSGLLAERDPAMLAFAEDNIRDNGFATRARTIAADVTLRGEARKAAALLPDSADTVIANPPFFTEGRGTAAAPDRLDARHLPPGALEDWVRTAAACAAPGGEVIFIHTADALPELLAAFTARFGAVTVLPLLPRPGERASRILLRGAKGSRAPFTLLASRALHGSDGRAFAPEFEAIFRGDGRLHW